MGLRNEQNPRCGGAKDFPLRRFFVPFTAGFADGHFDRAANRNSIHRIPPGGMPCILLILMI